MSIVVRFNPTNLTTEKYDESLRRLEEADVEFPPDGLDYHICFGSEGNLRVSEIWDSREQLEAFGEKLMPHPGRHRNRVFRRTRDLRGSQHRQALGVARFGSRFAQPSS